MTMSSNDLHSAYLVERIRARDDENIFNYVKFRVVAAALRELRRPRLRVADMGCADQVARRYLERLGVDMDYVGLDYEASLQPGLVADLRVPEGIEARLPWRPDVILLLDVLEHLDGREADIRRLLAFCARILPPTGVVLASLPQLYRLDRFKLPHLHYAEHKIRLHQEEWRALLAEHLRVERAHGVGYISTLPYFVMWHPGYRDDNHLGRVFRFLRERALDGAVLRRLDHAISARVGGVPGIRSWSNDVLFVCRAPARPGGGS